MNNMNFAAATTSEKIPLEQVSPVAPPVAPDRAQKITEQMRVGNIQKAEADKKEESQFTAQEAKDLAEGLNEIMDDLQTSLGFFIRDDLNHQVVVEIKNRETNELIKQIPSEELLSIKEKMEELTGLIFDHTV